MGFTPRVLGTALATAALLAGAPAAPCAAVQVEQAPGRVLFAVGGGRATLDAGIALPEGGALLAGSVPHSGRVYIAKVTSAGALDPSFGSGGVATVDAQLALDQMLVQQDGRILLVGRHSPRGFVSELRWDTPHLPLVAVRLNADGSIDRSYGAGGTARTGIEGGCQCSRVAVLGADGLLTVTGQNETKVRRSWGTEAVYTWVLARLSAAGAFDPAFGARGVAVVPGEQGVGLSLEAGPGGSLTAQGQQQVKEKSSEGGVTTGPANLMTRITRAGAIDPGYGSGVPFRLPVFSLDDSYGQVPEPLEASTDAGGNVVVETVVPGNHAPKERGIGVGLVAYDPSGRPDATFGYGGYLNFEELPEPAGSFLVREPDASVLAIHAAGVPEEADVLREDLRREPRTVPSLLQAERITPRGAFDLTFAAPPGRPTPVAFGGGGDEELPDIHDPFGEERQALGENTLLSSRPLVLPLAGGSLLVGGTVWLAPSGRTVTNRFGFAILTPSFALDPAAGGPAKAPSVALSAPRRLSRPFVYRVRLPFSVRSSGPGLTRIELFAARHLVARRVIATAAGARRRVLVQVPLSGRRFLHAHRRARVRAVAVFRDLFGQQATSTLPSR